MEKCVWRRACRSLDSGLVSLASPSFLPARSPRCSPRRGREGWGCDFSWAAGLCFVLGVHRCPLLATPRGGRDWPHFSQEDTDSRWDVACPGLPCQGGKGLASRRPEFEATEGAEAEDAVVVALCPEHLARALSHFAAGLQVLSENDPNRERSLRVARAVHCALARLRELLRERRRQARAAAGPPEAP